jgi:hypothetical protein
MDDTSSGRWVEIELTERPALVVHPSPSQLAERQHVEVDCPMLARFRGSNPLQGATKTSNDDDLRPRARRRTIRKTKHGHYSSRTVISKVMELWVLGFRA